MKRSVRKFLDVAVRNGKEMYQKELLCCTCKIVVFLIKPILLYSLSHCPPSSSNLKVPNADAIHINYIAAYDYASTPSEYTLAVSFHRLGRNQVPLVVSH